MNTSYLPTDVRIFAALQGKRVLVADDNALNREVASDFLSQVGVQVLTAVDGVDAIRCLQEQAVDAVLMDIHMPHMDGLSATREIRRDARWQHLPIIALTAQARSEDVWISREAGMNGHLTKPIDEVALYSTLLEHCVGQVPSSNAASVNERSGTVVNEGKSGDFPRLPRAPVRRAHLLRGFLKDFALLPERFDRWLAQSQWAEIASAAHQIKGSASYLDATALCLVAEKLESAARGGQADVVQKLAQRFVAEVNTCLLSVGKALEDLAGAASDASSSSLNQDSRAVIELVERAQPLVSSGNFAAQRLLEELLVSSSGKNWMPTALEALQAFDDLDTERTLQLLAEIAQAFQAPRMQ